jgi:hypothetical protein
MQLTIQYVPAELRESRGERTVGIYKSGEPHGRNGNSRSRHSFYERHCAARVVASQLWDLFLVLVAVNLGARTTMSS